MTTLITAAENAQAFDGTVWDSVHVYAHSGYIVAAFSTGIDSSFEVRSADGTPVGIVGWDCCGEGYIPHIDQVIQMALEREVECPFDI
jgi:hypothetical protein